MNLEGIVTEVTKEPREYFAEWRAQVEAARQRREARGLTVWSERQGPGRCAQRAAQPDHRVTSTARTAPSSGRSRYCR